MLRKAAKQIGVCATGLILFCIICRVTFFRTYTVHIPLDHRMMQENGANAPGPKAVIGSPEVAELAVEGIRDDRMDIRIQPMQAGEAEIHVLSPDGEDRMSYYLRVTPLGTIYDPQTSGFTGDTAVMIAVTLFWLLVSSIMLWHYFQAKGPDYYNYSTIYFAGFSLFSLVTGLLMFRVTLSHILHPQYYNMLEAYSVINGTPMRYMMLTMPAMLLFAAAMAGSNCQLLLHERLGIQNVLGLIVSLLLIAGEAVGMYFFTRNFVGSERQMHVHETIHNVYASIFVYMECMLTGSVICGITAARNQPEYDKDFIIILGCWFRKDGTLPPLLRGRVDRALSFWREQKEETGKEAVFIPSGGQGKDEPMPEGEAMRRYLIENGIPDNAIRPETKSRNTYQNMAYSKEILEETKPGGSAVFATTNYHVFRSGIWAADAGLRAEGIGGKTRWWYWPNAFMREWVGLLVKRWREELLLLFVLIAYFGTLSMVLG